MRKLILILIMSFLVNCEKDYRICAECYTVHYVLQDNALQLDTSKPVEENIFCDDELHRNNGSIRIEEINGIITVKLTTCVNFRKN
mgnify:CR=1 FL=1